MAHTRPLLAILCLVWPAGVWAALEQSDAAGLDFFEKKIRPVLAEKCYKCHSADAEKIKGGLLLDTREGIRRGGDDGPAVVPGKLEESLLIDAIRYQHKDTAMPPAKSGGKLPDAVIRDFEKWVQMGAPDPREGEKKVVLKKESYEEAKKWWAWQPPHKSAAPFVQNSTWPKTDIDRFLLAGLSAKGLAPVGDADKATLLRRVYFDLIGLPPPPEALDAFLRDTAPDAFVKLVDRLLASPQYGERWGRHWLDVARYAESSGKDVNIAFPDAWRYRDYVVAAFNADKPYDQFIREQIAGDLLPAKDDRTRAEHLVATGFLAIGPKGLNERDPRQFALDLADEQIETMSQAFLGVTIACARCHDHKFDPIPQRDYYALAGIFLSTDTHYGTAGGIQNRRPTDLIELPAADAQPVVAKSMPVEERRRKEQRLEELKKEQREIFTERFAAMRAAGGAGAAGASPLNADPRKQQRILILLTQIGQLEAELKAFDASGQPRALAMGVRDLPTTRPAPAFGGFGRRPMGGGFPGQFGRAPGFSTIADSPLYTRGDVDKPGEKVPRGFAEILTKGRAPAIPAETSGRLQLADWLTAPENPTTARVMVNRVWHWLFGEGIVSTPDNFGTTGHLPSNQALLDTLAVEFREGGWSVKKLVREIVLSHAYQLASTHDAKSFAVDPENTLHWRMNKRRLDAECIRDAVLVASGQLETSAPAGSAIALAGNGPIGGRAFGVSETTIVDAGSRTNVRSLYLPIARDILPDALSVFDFPEPSLVTGSRETTNVPSQALFMLNSPFIGRASEKLAERVTAAVPNEINFEQRVQLAYRLVFGRAPTIAEKSAAAQFFNRVPEQPRANDAPARVLSLSAPGLNWATYCRALLASAEFRYLD
jgi:cytochrome c553